MAKSIKLENEIYIDSTGIIHEKEKLSDILNRNKYSIEEVKINNLWINNEPMYRKVIELTTLTASVHRIDFNVEFETIINAECWVCDSSGSWRPIPWLFTNNDSYGAASWSGGFYINNSSIVIQAGTNLSNITKGHIIVEYTKNV